MRGARTLNVRVVSSYGYFCVTRFIMVECTVTFAWTFNRHLLQHCLDYKQKFTMYYVFGELLVWLPVGSVYIYRQIVFMQF